MLLSKCAEGGPLHQYLVAGLEHCAIDAMASGVRPLRRPLHAQGVLGGGDHQHPLRRDLDDIPAPEQVTGPVYGQLRLVGADIFQEGAAGRGIDDLHHLAVDAEEAVHGELLGIGEDQHGVLRADGAGELLAFQEVGVVGGLHRRLPALRADGVGVVRGVQAGRSPSDEGDQLFDQEVVQRAAMVL